MKVDIFIQTTFKGNFAKGEGAYGILLQVMRGGIPKTKEHYAGWSGTTCQRLNIRAAAEALNYMTIPCDVIIHTGSCYVKSVADSGDPKGRNEDVWMAFFAARNRMESVTIQQEGRHEYSAYLKQSWRKRNTLWSVTNKRRNETDGRKRSKKRAVSHIWGI